MKKAKLFLLLLSAIFFLGPVQAQNAINIAIDSATLLPDTVIANQGSTFNFRVVVRNDSNFTFNGHLLLSYTIDTANFFFSNNTSGFEYPAFADSVLTPGETDTTSLIAHVSPPAFKVGGPSVVVIWPRAFGAYASDSIRFQIIVLDPTGINDPAGDNIRAFIWNNNLQIQKQGEITLKRVRIYDLLGREIVNVPNPSDRTTLPEMPSGVYLTEITYNNNQRKVFRFYQ
jgi:hypothetical protein